MIDSITGLGREDLGEHHLTTTALPKVDDPALIPRNIIGLTAHTEKTQTALQLPTLLPTIITTQDSSPTYTAVYVSTEEDSKSSRAKAVPQTVHTESSETSLMVPTLAQSTAAVVWIQPAVTTTSYAQSINPIYVSNVETTKPQLQAITAPTTTIVAASSATSFYTSAGTPYSIDVPAYSSSAILETESASDSTDFPLHTNSPTSLLSEYTASTFTAMALTTAVTSNAGIQAVSTTTGLIATSTNIAASTTAKVQIGAAVTLQAYLWPAVLSILALLAQM